ncbi:hypothetical protein ACFSWE_00230 [Leucobacter albus]|uniref:Secreted protein n=1 Tax=Leucobacter albus TaxID=272210 RepID=A0ABW3TV77_9MICO
MTRTAAPQQPAKLLAATQRTSPQHRPNLRRLALLTLPVAALLLAGCSAPGAQEDPAESGGGSAETLHSWSVKYAKCMQDEGIAYPDPPADENGAMQALNIDELGGMEVFEAADEVCQGKIGAPPAPTGADGKPMTEESMRKETLELTRCLREQGIDVEDPAEGLGLTLTDDIPEEAFEACGLGGMISSVG